jgi:hypothetical protein
MIPTDKARRDGIFPPYHELTWEMFLLFLVWRHNCGIFVQHENPAVIYLGAKRVARLSHSNFDSYSPQ